MAQRISFDMDREWKFHLGDIITGRINSHSASYVSCHAGTISGVPSENFDDSDWRVLDLPHDYLIEAGFGKDNLGSQGYRERSNAWYRKSFTMDESLKGKHFMLCFDGLAMQAEVYFNGSLIAHSFSAYCELSIDLTERMHYGKQLNTLAVYIDGMTTEGWWYEGSGIYRHVHLFVKDSLHIAQNGLWANPVWQKDTENDWILEMETTLQNSEYTPADGCVRTTVYDDTQVIAQQVSPIVTVPADDKLAVMQKIPVQNPKRWDVDAPNLYRVEVELLRDGKEIDEDSTRFGFRTIAADNNQGFLLNGKKLILKGTSNHQDHAGVGVAVPDSIQYYRIRRLKEMGVNAYRSAHNMPSKVILDACDEIGLVVMDENRRFETRTDVIGNVQTMVLRDRNHPSVVMYSLFNEEPLQITPEGKAIYKKLKSAVQKLDTTRLMTGAINATYNPEGTAPEMDIAGFNYNLDAMEDAHRQYPDIAITGTENNSAVTSRGCYLTDMDKHILDNYDDSVVPWGQTVRTTWKFITEHPFVGGIFIWTGFDYRGEPSPFEWPSCSSFFGIMDLCGFPKDSFYFNQACFIDQPMIHLLPHWNWTEGESVKVMTVTNCDEAELFLNGKSLGRKPSDVCTQCEWQVTFVPGVLSAKGYRNGKEVCSTENITAGKPYAVKINPDRTWIGDDGKDTVPLNICVVDKEGNVVPTASDMIHFVVEGDGKILGVGNGDPNCHEPDILPQRSLYSGWCQGLVQSFLHAKKLSVTVSAEGLISDQVTFEIKEFPTEPFFTAPQTRMLDKWYVSHKIFKERPDPLMKVEDNDMNSFEPVTLRRMDFGELGYRIFETKFTVPKTLEQDTVYLEFNRIYVGEMELYKNGACIYTGEHIDQASLVVSVPCKPGEEIHLRMLLHRTDWCRINYASLWLK